MASLLPTFSHMPPNPWAYGFQTHTNPAAHSHAVAAPGQGSVVLVVVKVVEVASCKPRNRRLLAAACEAKRRKARLLWSPSFLLLNGMGESAGIAFCQAIGEPLLIRLRGLR